MPALHTPATREPRANAPRPRPRRGADHAPPTAAAIESPDAPAVSPTKTRREIAQHASDVSAEKRERARADALADLPPLRTPEDALDRLDRIGLLALRGIVPGSGAHAAGQATRTWLEVQKAAATLTRVRQLTERIAELERELVAARALLSMEAHTDG